MYEKGLSKTLEVPEDLSKSEFETEAHIYTAGQFRDGGEWLTKI